MLLIRTGSPRDRARKGSVENRLAGGKARDLPVLHHQHRMPGPWVPLWAADSATLLPSLASSSGPWKDSRPCLVPVGPVQPSSPRPSVPPCTSLTVLYLSSCTAPPVPLSPSQCAPVIHRVYRWVAGWRLQVPHVFLCGPRAKGLHHPLCHETWTERIQTPRGAFSGPGERERESEFQLSKTAAEGRSRVRGYCLEVEKREIYG